MGSDSDWPVMEAAVVALEELGVACEVDVVSAHRMPEEMVEYGRSAEARGLRVIIAGAGGAAHLPGMLASVTPLPVIGVPVPLKYLDGMDSLLSIVQMPAGVPVATVSVGGARNAGLLAARILGAGEGAGGGAAARCAGRSSARTCATRPTPRGPRCGSVAPGRDRSGSVLLHRVSRTCPGRSTSVGMSCSLDRAPAGKPVDRCAWWRAQWCGEPAALGRARRGEQ